MSGTHIRSARLAPEADAHVASRPSASAPPESFDALAVQRLVGNRVVSGLLAPERTEAAGPGPALHQRAAIVGSGAALDPQLQAIVEGAHASAPRSENEREAQRAAAAPNVATAAGPHPAPAVASTRAGGLPLPYADRARLEPYFGLDLGGVRIHVDAAAQVAAAQLRARAFTRGADIYFGTGRFQPGTQAGRALISHEVAHVAQQMPPGIVQCQPDEDRPIPVRVIAQPPGRVNEVASMGVNLPAVGPIEDVQRHADYIDRQVTAVGYSPFIGGYLLYLEGSPTSYFLPSQDVDIRPSYRAVPVGRTVYPDYETARAAIEAAVFPEFLSASPRQSLASTLDRYISRPTAVPPYAYFRAAVRGAPIVPTSFSVASAPRTIELIRGAIVLKSEQVQHDLADLQKSIVLQGLAKGIVPLASRLLERILSRRLQGELAPPHREDAAPGSSAATKAPPPTQKPPSRATSETSAKSSAATGSGASRARSASARTEREASSPAPLPAFQREIADALSEEHPGLHPTVASEAARGGRAAAGKGGAGADVLLVNGGGREVSVHHGEFTTARVRSHLLGEAEQAGTTEIYLQLPAEATKQEAISMMTSLRNSSMELRGIVVRVFGSRGETWWSGKFGGPQ